MGYRLGIDTGGTFTDLVLVGEDGGWELFKTPSTPDDPPLAIRRGIDLIAEALQIATERFLHDCDLIIHGTTVALNALIQHKGAKVGLFCTGGHQDSLEIRLAHKEDGHRYDFFFPAAQMLIPRSLRVPVTERVTSAGKVLLPLDEASVLQGIEKFKAEGVEAVVVCFLWSFLHPVHEQRVAELVRQHLPDVYLTLSTELLPQIREYARVSTAAVNGFVGPVLQRSIDEVESLLRDLGYQNAIRYMQCNGGVSSGDFIGTRAVYAINSGPAAGPTAALHFGKLADQSHLLTLDMGGTSTDISIVQEGRVDLVKNLEVERYLLGIPLVNVVNIGAGGGSIAWQDAQGILRVGPQSAEAIPGPACYGRGGEEATVTDALAVLGYLNPDYLLGGTFKIDSEASRRVVRERVAKPLGLPLERAALGIFEVVNSNMIGGIRAVSVERGYDPRDFIFVAGGGATSAHVARLAADLGVEQIIIPKVASGLCAFGEAIADVRHSHMATYITPLRQLDLQHLNRLLSQLEQKGRAELTQEGFQQSEMMVERALEMRYADQVHECNVPIPLQGKLDQASLGEIEALFHRRHEELYTYCETNNPPELVNLEVTLVGQREIDAHSLFPRRVRESDAPPKESSREAYFQELGGFARVPIYDGKTVPRERDFFGPAIIEEPTTTIVIPPGWKIALQHGGYYLMTR